MHSPLQSPLQPVMRSPLEFRRRGGGSFDIASTNPSAYYDRTVLATLFQDSAGTTPVTAGSQPIGLGLDQSQGLALGPELVTNGDFSDGGAGWAFNDPTISVSGGRLNFTGTPDIKYAGQLSTSTSGKVCSVEMVVDSVTEGAIGFQFDRDVGANIRITSAGTYTYTLAQSPSYSGLYIVSYGVSTTAIVSSITIKVVSGNHASQPTAGKRPLTAGSPIYANFDAVDDDLVATFPTSLGAGCTVCRSLPGTGADITTGVTLTDTYTDNVDAHALLIYTAAQWAALDAGQIANITTWLNGRAGL